MFLILFGRFGRFRRYERIPLEISHKMRLTRVRGVFFDSVSRLIFVFEKNKGPVISRGIRSCLCLISFKPRFKPASNPFQTHFKPPSNPPGSAPKSSQKSSQNHPKIIPKSFPNHQQKSSKHLYKIRQNSTLNLSKIVTCFI